MKAVLVAIDVVDVPSGADPEFTGQKITVLIPFTEDLGKVVKMTTVHGLLAESLAVIAKHVRPEDVRLSDLFKEAFA